MKKVTGKQQPFFAKFLENQLQKEAENNIQAGATLKYPSDIEDESKKYPSDQEDDTTKPALDQYHTDKYPSDNDEDKI